MAMRLMRDAFLRCAGGEESAGYFDPSERRFFRLRKDDPRDRSGLMPLPQLDEAALCREYMEMHGCDQFLEECGALPEKEFVVAARFYADHHGFEEEYTGFIRSRVDDLAYDWAVENGVENWMLYLKPLGISLQGRSDAEIRRIAWNYNRVQAWIEAEDERIYKILRDAGMKPREERRIAHNTQGMEG